MANVMEIFMSLGLFFLFMFGLSMLYVVGAFMAGVFSVDKKTYKDSLARVTGWERWVDIVISTLKYRHDLLFFHSIIFAFLSILMFFFTGNKQ